jgi:hypothetical protein
MAAERQRAPVFESLLTDYSLANKENLTWVP